MGNGSCSFKRSVEDNEENVCLVNEKVLPKYDSSIEKFDIFFDEEDEKELVKQGFRPHAGDEDTHHLVEKQSFTPGVEEDTCSHHVIENDVQQGFIPRVEDAHHVIENDEKQSSSPCVKEDKGDIYHVIENDAKQNYSPRMKENEENIYHATKNDVKQGCTPRIEECHHESPIEEADIVDGESSDEKKNVKQDQVKERFTPRVKEDEENKNHVNENEGEQRFTPRVDEDVHHVNKNHINQAPTAEEEDEGGYHDAVEYVVPKYDRPVEEAGIVDGELRLEDQKQVGKQSFIPPVEANGEELPLVTENTFPQHGGPNEDEDIAAGDYTHDKHQDVIQVKKEVENIKDLLKDQENQTFDEGINLSEIQNQSGRPKLGAFRIVDANNANNGTVGDLKTSQYLEPDKGGEEISEDLKPEEQKKEFDVGTFDDANNPIWDSQKPRPTNKDNNIKMASTNSERILADIKRNQAAKESNKEFETIFSARFTTQSSLPLEQSVQENDITLNDID